MFSSYHGVRYINSFVLSNNHASGSGYTKYILFTASASIPNAYEAIEGRIKEEYILRLEVRYVYFYFSYILLCKDPVMLNDSLGSVFDW